MAGEKVFSPAKILITGIGVADSNSHGVIL
jgi:hypothetical protein